MSLRYWIRGQDQELFEITDRMDFGFSGSEHLEEASSAVQTFTIRDPLSDLELWGHRIFAVEETEAEDPEDRFIFVGYIGRTVIKRGPYLTGVSRVWEIEVSDLNTVLTRRIMVGNGNDRPAETDVERIEWVEATHEGELIDDTRYLSTANPVNMDANDYLLQPALNVYSDDGEQSGKNYGLTYFGDVGVDTRNPWGSFSLWYDFAASDAYQSAASLTNVLADIDNVSTFPMSPADELAIDWMRVFSTIIVPYKETYVLVSRDTTRTTTARRDQVMNAPNVKTKATATARANRYVQDLATPDYRATIRTIVPRAKVNAIRPGMAVQVFATHWASVIGDEYVWMRVMSRKVTELSEGDEETYLEEFQLSWAQPAPPAPPVYGILRMALGPADGTSLDWGFPGDTPAPGYPLEPTTGLIEPIEDLTPTNGGWPYTGWKVNGTGTVDVTFFATAKGVVMTTPVTVVVTYAIQLNGATVASTVDSFTISSGFAFVTSEATVSVAALAVVPDDVITARVFYSPPIAGPLTVPLASGQNGERLEITGGSLA